METESTIGSQELLAALGLAAGLAGKTARSSNTSGTADKPDQYSIKSNPNTLPEFNKALSSMVEKGNYGTANVENDIKGVRNMKPGDRNYPGEFVTFTAKDGRKRYEVGTDYNQDKAILAHELGHYLTAHSPLMKQVVNARHFLGNNPMLRDALDKGISIGPIATGPLKGITPNQIFKTSRYALPAAVAGIMPGDDDVAASVAVGLALSSPTLVDEFMATKRGFDLMKEAGQPIPLKSRARMAGAFTSYLANPLLAAFGGNYLGNLVDSNG